MSLRIAFIGAGSVGFTRKLVKDILLVPELRDTHFALHDIDARNLDAIAQVLRKGIDANELPATLSTHAERRPALEGANYVINCTRIGGLEAFKTDIEIPLRYGIDQCVGDTLCAGGIMYGQRNIPQILAFQRDIKAHAAEGAMLLNYANPMAMNTWAGLDAADRGEGVEMIGLCHGVQHGHHQIAGALIRAQDGSDGAEGAEGKISWEQATSRVQIVCAGINHQTWYIKIVFDGREVGADELLAAFENNAHIVRTEKTRLDVLRRFGVYSTESNGHLSEYLPWYRKRPEEIGRWIDPQGQWVHGESGGYLRMCIENHAWFHDEFPQVLEKSGTTMDTWKRSEEHGSRIIEALETGRPYRGHFNVRNRGVIANLPGDCVIEAPGYIDAAGFQMMAGIELPQACAATCRASIDVQRMAKDAAVAGDVTLLKQAMLHDPLTAAVCDPDEVWQMTDQMLIAQARWLPNYEPGAIEAARRRLADHDKAGTRVKLRDWEGAAPKPVATA